jgi:hypothetical protein
MQAIHLEHTERLEAATNKWKTRQTEIEGATVFWPVVGDDLNTGEKMATEQNADLLTIQQTFPPLNISNRRDWTSQYTYINVPHL